MKRRKTTDKVSTRAITGIERIAHLQEQLARAPANSRRRQALRGAIRVETDAYRKSLDSEQAAATHDAKPVRAPEVNRRLGIR